GHRGDDCGPRLPATACTPATSSPAAIAAPHGGNAPATGVRGSLRAYHAPMPATTPNRSAAINPPASAFIANVAYCDTNGSGGRRFHCPDAPTLSQLAR